MLSKIASFMFAVLWIIAVVYALVLVVSWIVKGVRSIKSKKEMVIDGTGTDSGNCT